MSNNPIDLSVQLGPQFTLVVENKSGQADAEAFSLVTDGPENLQIGVDDSSKPMNLELQPAQEMFTLEVGVKSSSLFANSGGGGGSSSGTVDVSVTAAVGIAAYRAVTILGTYVQPNYASLSSYAGVSRSSMAPGVTADVVRSGLLNGGGPWIPNQPVFVTNNGVLTQTLPSESWRRIGYAVSASQVNLDPFPFLELSSANW